jgi:pimeloyl-ACP methyl ester carboxylesterase
VPPKSPRRLCAAAVALALTFPAAACTADVLGGRGRATTATSSGASSSPTPSGTGSPTGSTGAAHFGSCTGIDLGSGSSQSGFDVSCARIRVPLDYAEPSGRQIDVAVVRLHRANSSASRPLLMDPGGPGGSGVQFATQIAGALPSSVTRTFDVVGFDPRGVGSSSPIRCLDDRQKDALNAAQPDVRTITGFAEAKRMAKQFTDACTAKYGAALADYDTVATARDMDRIRAALGTAKLDYLGFSYGTELGAQYAHLFPDRVGALVLDGAVDPLTDAITSFADQLEGFEKAFDQFAAWCHDHDPCSTLGNPRTAVYDLVARTRTQPMRSSAPGETRTATSSIVLLGVLSGLYSQSYWEVLGESLVLAKQGDARGLFQLADVYNERDSSGHYTNISDSNLAISCNDSPVGPSDAVIRATTDSWVRRFPMFGLWSAASLFGCQQWQPHRTVPPKPTAADSTNTILVIGNLHDPATPYQGAKDLTATLGKARLLTWDGEGHTSFLQGSSCVDDAVTAYLLHNTLPAAGTTCPR